MCTELGNEAAKVAGKSRPAYGLSTNELTDVKSVANRLISQYSTRRLFMFTVAAQRFTLTPSQTSYTIGPTGDFVTARPTFIKNANIVLTSVSPEVRVPLDIWDDDQWADTRVQPIPPTLPTAIYYDGGLSQTAGLGTIYFWGYPTVANDFAMFAPQFLTQFADLTTSVTFAPGYEEMLVTSVAERMCPQWGLAVNATLAEQARRARAAVVSLNSRSAPNLSNDAANINGQPQKPYFNYLTG